MNDFLTKYYPGIKQQLHEQRIKKLEELLKEEKEKYKKEYDTEPK